MRFFNGCVFSLQSWSRVRIFTPSFKAFGAALLICAGLSAADAQAGFLDDLFGLSEPAPPRRLRMAPDVTPRSPEGDWTAERRAKRRAAIRSDRRLIGSISSAQRVANRDRRGPTDVYGNGSGGRGHEFGRFVCVRMCDGAVIALARPDKAAPGEPRCDSACPGAETRLYTLQSTGDDMSTAVDQSSKTSYAELVARLKSIADKPSCTCGSVVAKADVNVDDFLEDATLRDGDVVATSEGLHIFRGQRRLPHKLTEFMALHDARMRLSRTTHGALDAINQTLKTRNGGAESAASAQ